MPRSSTDFAPINRARSFLRLLPSAMACSFFVVTGCSTNDLVRPAQTACCWRQSGSGRAFFLCPRRQDAFLFARLKRPIVERVNSGFHFGQLIGPVPKV